MVYTVVMDELQYREAGRTQSATYVCETEVCGGMVRHTAKRDGYAYIFIGFDSAGRPQRSVIVCPSCYRAAVEIK